MGNYQIVLSLLSSLDHGRDMKRLVDQVIDACVLFCLYLVFMLTQTGDAVINLRENVMELRIKYSVSAMDDKGRQALLERALRAVSSSIEWH
jgi:hypothetical protein